MSLTNSVIDFVLANYELISLSSLKAKYQYYHKTMVPIEHALHRNLPRLAAEYDNTNIININFLAYAVYPYRFFLADVFEKNVAFAYAYNLVNLSEAVNRAAGPYGLTLVCFFINLLGYHQYFNNIKKRKRWVIACVYFLLILSKFSFNSTEKDKCHIKEICKIIYREMNDNNGTLAFINKNRHFFRRGQTESHKVIIKVLKRLVNPTANQQTKKIRPLAHAYRPLSRSVTTSGYFGGRL